MANWTQETILQFLELYQAEPVIWDPKEPNHKDKKKINDAWIRIQNTMNIPIKELKAKKDSLMATFRGYLRKKQASIKSGASSDDIYNPIWFAYDIMEQFLAPVFHCNDTINTERNVSIHSSLFLNGKI